MEVGGAASVAALVVPSGVEGGFLGVVIGCGAVVSSDVVGGGSRRGRGASGGTIFGFFPIPMSLRSVTCCCWSVRALYDGVG